MNTLWLVFVINCSWTKFKPVPDGGCESAEYKPACISELKSFNTEKLALDFYGQNDGNARIYRGDFENNCVIIDGKRGYRCIDRVIKFAELELEKTSTWRVVKEKK